VLAWQLAWEGPPSWPLHMIIVDNKCLQAIPHCTKRPNAAARPLQDLDYALFKVKHTSYQKNAAKDYWGE